MEQQQLEQYRVDHLILLVGGNPLPNYVAARVLAKPGATLHFVHTQKTDPIAKRLSDALKLPAENDQLGRDFATSQFIQVDESNPRDIFDKVKEIASALPRDKKIGLNYTGGNRPMSVHAYDAVDETRSDAIFSYLDAGRLTMLIHDQQRSTRLVRADKLLNMRLETLLKLQGLTQKGKEPSDKPLQPKLAAALAELHTTDEGADAWFDWRKKSDGWKKLPKGEPRLEKIEAALREMCGDQEPTPECVAQALGQNSLPSCAKWFKGGWLESHVLSQLQEAIRERSDTDDALMSIQRTRDGQNDELDIDVVVMRSYQMFVFSCMVSKQDDPCKFHAMEAYVRARQTGGDEARVCLVCTYSKPDQLQKKLVSELDAGGKIKVFGQKDLMSLSTKISDWLNQQP